MNDARSTYRYITLQLSLQQDLTIENLHRYSMPRYVLQYKDVACNARIIFDVPYVKETLEELLQSYGHDGSVRLLMLFFKVAPKYYRQRFMNYVLQGHKVKDSRWIMPKSVVHKVVEAWRTRHLPLKENSR